jgi:hypothetical protein
MSDVLKAYSAHYRSVQKSSSDLLSALFYVSMACDQHRLQSYALLELLIIKQVVPVAYEVFANDFAFDTLSMAPLRERRARLPRVIETKIAPLQLPPHHKFMLQRHLGLIFLQVIEPPARPIQNPRDFEATLAAVASAAAKASETDRIVIDKAAEFLKLLREDQPMAVNLKFVECALAFLDSSSPTLTRLALAQAQNTAVFQFVGTITAMALDRTIASIVFSKDEVLQLQVLIMAANQLQSEGECRG